MSRPKIERNDKIKKLRKKGLSYRQLAKLFDIDVKVVFDIVNRDERRAVGSYPQVRS